MISVRQVKAARALLAWSQSELAAASGVSEPTIARLESIDGPLGGRADTSDKIVNALEAAGVEFIPQNGGGAGVRLKLAVPHLLRHSVSAFDGYVLLEVEYRGEKHMMRLPATVLEDMDRANYRADQELAESFERHRPLVLLRVAAAIDSGRRGEGNQPLGLTDGDFPEAS